MTMQGTEMKLEFFKLTFSRLIKSGKKNYLDTFL